MATREGDVNSGVVATREGDVNSGVVATREGDVNSRAVATREGDVNSVGEWDREGIVNSRRVLPEKFMENLLKFYTSCAVFLLHCYCNVLAPFPNLLYHIFPTLL